MRQLNFLLCIPPLVAMGACSPLPPKHEVEYVITCNVNTRYHRQYDYYHIPATVDTQSTAARTVPAGKVLVGYENSWSESGIGNINHRYLGFAYRGFVFCDEEQFPNKGLVVSAVLHFPHVSTERASGTHASNSGSAAYYIHHLTQPFAGFSTNHELISALPVDTGTVANATYSAGSGLSIELTTLFNRIVNQYDPNHGFMLSGTNESYQHNNDYFLSFYTAPTLTLRVLEPISD